MVWTWLTVVVLGVVTTVANVVQGIDHHHQHPLNRLNMMVDKVESSIWEKKQRLGGAHIYHPNQHEWDEGEVSIVESAMEEQATHPEDMQDYVNNAPWTRRTKHSPAVHIINMQLINLVAANAQRVKTKGRCEEPRQRCEAIRSPEHPADTAFLPRCALLHRCAEDTGCCLTDDHICAAEDTENVELYFYAVGDMSATIEKMTFVNHTRCSCQSRNIVPSCKCPRYYSPKSVEGQCTCDCDIGRSKCRRFKKGRRYFSQTDVRCISSGECVEPTCEYGPFLTRQRRCTKRRERERYITSRK
ncbi:hypothetical protein GWK47_051295 [Chionoecetes opilio]|uniref:Platelet-derived growth factor (PDGF) family profile domain-containing protein n=1 Tax=Chionoecetes opilio TaxID=41210 RepID=A0A8J4Y0W8_CHIOP|nr:hypothetical protein GWK47_051295 [Chionoecetes opilio]